MMPDKHIVMIGGLTSYAVELIEALKVQGDISITHLVRYFDDLQKGHLAQCGGDTNSVRLFDDADDLRIEISDLIETTEIDAVLVFPPYYTLHPFVDAMCVIKGNASICTAEEVHELFDFSDPLQSASAKLTWLTALLDALRDAGYKGHIEYLKLMSGFLEKQHIDDVGEYTTYIDDSSEFYNLLSLSIDRYIKAGMSLYVNDIGLFIDDALKVIVKEQDVFLAHPPVSVEAFAKDFLKRIDGIYLYE